MFASRKLAAVLMASSFLMPATAYAATNDAAEPVQSDPATFATEEGETTVAPDGLRSVTPVEGSGLQLGTLEGDNVEIQDGVALWTDSQGDLVAQIALRGEGDQDLVFSYDSVSKRIAPETSSEASTPFVGDMMYANSARCMPSWVGWGWNIAWGGLVCLPLGVGVGAVATPIAGVATDLACNAAGGALTTATAC